jgi:dTDP-4-dehydrorhamnose 3,5-epimerase
MIFTETKLKGAYIIDLNRVEDDRGFFGRVWCKREFEEHGLVADMAQANISFSKKKGTLRGLHYQREPHAEAKTIRCTMGSIWDVIVDLRPTSETYKQWIGVELTAENFRMLHIPKGFAHGFITLEDDTAVHYMVSTFYSPGAESGVRYNDPAFNIAWPIEPSIITAKDAQHPLYLEEVTN